MPVPCAICEGGKRPLLKPQCGKLQQQNAVQCWKIKNLSEQKLNRFSSKVHLKMDKFRFVDLTNVNPLLWPPQHDYDMRVDDFLRRTQAVVSSRRERERQRDRERGGPRRDRERERVRERDRERERDKERGRYRRWCTDRQHPKRASPKNIYIYIFFSQWLPKGKKAVCCLSLSVYVNKTFFFFFLETEKCFVFSLKLQIWCFVRKKKWHVNFHDPPLQLQLSSFFFFSVLARNISLVSSVFLSLANSN